MDNNDQTNSQHIEDNQAHHWKQSSRTDSERAEGHKPLSSTLELEKLNRTLATDTTCLELKIHDLERSKSQYRAQLRAKAEHVKDTKADLEETRTQLVMAEEKVDEMEQLIERLLRTVERYRGWWLTEYHSLRALLVLVPDSEDVEAITSSAHARYRVHAAAE